MKKQTLLLIAVLISCTTLAQNVGIGTITPDASAQLEVSATDKGMLIPRMTSAERSAIVTPATGLLVFDNETNSFWFYDGLVWKPLSVQPSGATNFRYYASTSQLLNANTYTKVNFDSQSFLNNATFSGSTFTAPESGIYNITTNLYIYGNHAGILQLGLYVNNVSRSGSTFNIINAIFQGVSFSDNVLLSAGDKVIVQANPNADMAASVGQSTFFTGFKIN